MLTLLSLNNKFFKAGNKFLCVPPPASITPRQDVTYTDGLAGLTAEEVSKCAAAISDNSEITNTTSTVYIDIGNIHRKVSVGNQVAISLNGTNYSFDVIGFNHDELTTPTAYGATTATRKAGITFQMHDLYATTYEMNFSDTNSSGWKSSAMRTSTMPTMKGYMPNDWGTIIKLVNKASGLGGGSTSGTEIVSDDCFLLAEVEVFGNITTSISGEGMQYAYYKSNSTVKNKGGSRYTWWERSPVSGSSGDFCRVLIDGSAARDAADFLYGVAFAFCV